MTVNRNDTTKNRKANHELAHHNLPQLSPHQRRVDDLGRAHAALKPGAYFWVDSFSGNEQLADSVNHLLVVGFYLVNIGYVTLALKIRRRGAPTRKRRSKASAQKSVWCCWCWVECIFSTWQCSRRCGTRTAP
jgi:hypothetical protein